VNRAALVVLALTIAGGCSRDDRPSAAAGAPAAAIAVAVAAPKAAPDLPEQPTEPAETAAPAELVNADPGCRALTKAALPLPAWWRNPAGRSHAEREAEAEALERPGAIGAAAPVFYGNCETQQIALGACAIEPRMATCHGGRWTLTCAADSDCPALSRCAWETSVGARPADRPGDFGVCERRCTTDADCGRSGLACARSLGICQPPGHKAEDQDQTELE
jgi:hypothetical protein